MNNTRIPRPIGTTEQGNLFNKTNDNTYYEKLYELTIHHYIRNNFSYCGIFMNIETFSRFINIEQTKIMGYIQSYGKAMAMVNKEIIGGDLSRALTNFSLNWVLEDRSAIQQQLTILTAEQQNSYKPFLTGEVNRTLKLSMESTMNAMQLLRSLGGGIAPMLNGDNANDGTPQEDYITVDKAVRLFKENGFTPLSHNEAQREQLYLEYNIENLVEVNALMQTGIDTSREGLQLNDVTKLDKQKVLKSDKHTDRRAHEVGIDLDEDLIS